MASTQGKVCIDVNVLLTAVLGRVGKETAYQELKSVAGRGCVSALTVHVFMHFAARHFPLTSLQYFLEDFHILPVTARDIAWAFSNVRDDDFEDAIQIAAAVHAQCDEFLTFDSRLQRTYQDLPQLTVRLLQS